MQTGNKVKRSYTIRESSHQKLDELSQKWGLSKTGVLEDLIDTALIDYPAKRIAVFSTEPFVALAKTQWDTPYTGNVIITFETGDTRQIVLYVEKMNFTDFVDFLSDKEKVANLLWDKIPNQENS